MIISIASHKGGIGKTTISANLSHCLSLANKDKPNKKGILVIDNDPQSNASQLLLGSEYEGDSLYEVYMDENVDVSKCIFKTPYEGVFCLPNVPATALIEKDLYDKKNGALILREKIRQYAIEHFDYTVIDNPPNMGIFVFESLLCSDFCIVPIESGSRFSIDGLVHAIEMIENVKTEANADLKFLRLLINKVDLRTGISKASVDMIRKRFGEENAFVTTIPVNTQIAQAEQLRRTIIRHDPRCSSAKAFRSLADEMLGILEAV